MDRKIYDLSWKTFQKVFNYFYLCVCRPILCVNCVNTFWCTVITSKLLKYCLKNLIMFFLHPLIYNCPAFATQISGHLKYKFFSNEMARLKSRFKHTHFCPFLPSFFFSHFSNTWILVSFTTNCSVCFITLSTSPNSYFCYWIQLKSFIPLLILCLRQKSFVQYMSILRLFRLLLIHWKGFWRFKTLFQLFNFFVHRITKIKLHKKTI